MVNRSNLDPELLDEFLKDSFEIVERAKILMQDFSSTQDPHCFEEFAQAIDRIMGVAYTFGLKEIGDMTRMGKEIGYKTSQISDIHKQLSIQSILSQLVKETEKNLRNIAKGVFIASENTLPLVQKLNQVNAGLGDLRSSVKSAR